MEALNDIVGAINGVVWEPLILFLGVGFLLQVMLQFMPLLKLAHKEGFDHIIMASSKGDFPNYEIGPNLARVVRNAYCTVTVVRD
ncbi:Universal stress protein family protein [Aliiroseovarius crassostreae]|uniref:hypothetical protein n=1 Tax=Aliiroseovarius crassostreae TaxID=154981 RepID=UPI0008E78822|nr:hypothetical protein [Aliiroseovarius crassostreae]SFU71788.1 Universal stress protein family protein [Aliiroseovarius crassostreae]